MVNETLDVELAQETALHLSPATLRFLRAVESGVADIGLGVKWLPGGERWFTSADWTDVEDLTADELLDEEGGVTGFGALVLRFVSDTEGDGCAI